jgi:hypothetical protein
MVLLVHADRCSIVLGKEDGGSLGISHRTLCYLLGNESNQFLFCQPPHCPGFFSCVALHYKRTMSN